MNLRRLSVGLLAFALTALTAPAFAADYVIDAAHTDVGFKVRHMGVSWVRGAFDKVEGTVSWDPATPDKALVQVTIDAASVNTRNEGRDKHLRNPDFFDVEKYPTITFVGTEVKDFKGDSLTLVGELTMHGVTKPIEMKVTDLSEDLDTGKGVKRGATAELVINRQDWGIAFNSMLGVGEAAVGDEVHIEIQVELNRVEPEAKTA